MTQKVKKSSARKQQGQQAAEKQNIQPRIVASDERAAVFVYDSGLVKVYPHGLMNLDINPELPREYDPRLQTSLARMEGHLLVGDLGYMRFEPSTASADEAPAGLQNPPAVVPSRGHYTVRAKVAETAHGIIREGADDFTLYMRAPKELLLAEGVSPETFFEAELHKLLSQMAIAHNYDMTSPAKPGTSENLRGACRRDSRGRFVKC